MKRSTVFGILVGLALAGMLWGGWFKQNSASSLGNSSSLMSTDSPATAAAPFRPISDTTFDASVERPTASLISGESTEREVPSSKLARFMEDSSPFQRLILQDGTITVQEYRDAASRSHACTESAAASIEGAVVNRLEERGGQLTFGFSAADQRAFEVLGKAYDGCHAEYFSSVAVAWMSSEGQARLAARWDEVATCMRARGASVPQNADRSEMIAISKAAGAGSLYDDCQASTAENQAIVRCMQEAGVLLRPNPTMRMMAEAAASANRQRVFGDCLAEAAGQ